MKQTKNSNLFFFILLIPFALYLNSANADEENVDAQFILNWDNSFLPLTNSTNSSEGTRLSQIAVAPNGTRLMVVFNHQESGAANDNDPYYVFSGNNGVSWSTPNPVFTSVGVNSIQPSISFDNLNKAHAVWVENEKTLLYAQEDNWPVTSTSIDSNVGGTVEEVDSPKMVASSSSILDVVWIERNATVGFGSPDIYHARSVNGGTNWNSSGIKLLSVVASRAPDMLVEGSTIHIVWQEEISTNDWEIKYVTSTDGGLNWSFPFITISDTGNGRSAERPSIVRKNGVLEVIYSEKDIGTAAEFLADQTIRHVTCAASCTLPASWTDSITASSFDVGANTHNSEVIISGMTTLNDCTIVSYHGTKDGLPDNNEIIFNTTSCESNNWTVVQEVTASSNRSLRPALATQGNFVYMVFTQAGNPPTSEDQIKFIRGELEEFVQIPTIYLPAIFK